MDILPILLGIGAVQLLAVISPGQSFVVVSRLALSSGPRAGMVAALGLAMGTAIWATAALLGLAVILETMTWLATLMKLAGAAYLLWLAVALWRGAAKPLPAVAGPAAPISAAFRLGLMTQLGNPKVVVFFGSIFVALVPTDAPLGLLVAAVALVSLNEALWYGGLSVALSGPTARRLYARAKAPIERAMAGALGIGLGTSAV